MSILDKCWKKTIPANSMLYEYLQQQYIFRSGSVPGIFNVIEINTHHKVEVDRWAFPSFYRSYMGRLIYRRVLLIKMWESHKNASVASLSKFLTILKHLCQITSFTDCFIETCLAEASEDAVMATWVPKVLQEWLIIEFKCGHGITHLYGGTQTRVRFHQNLVSFKCLHIYCDTTTQPFRLEVLVFKTPNMAHTGYATRCWSHLF